jgi:hypothetical protein
MTSLSATRKLPRESVVEIGDLQEPGIYELKAGETLTGRFAVNFFDPAESDLQNLAPGRHSPKNIVSDSGITLENPYTWAVWIGTIIILILILSDWWVLKPKPVT